jgi:hypothetical protein
MAVISRTPGGGKKITNGATIQAKAESGTIPAGNFVEFTKGQIEDNREALYAGATNVSQGGSMVEISPGKALLICSDGSHGYLILADINSNPMKILSKKRSDMYFRYTALTKIEENKAIVTDSYNGVRSAIVTVSSNTITVGPFVQVNNASEEGSSPLNGATCLIDTDKVLISWGVNADRGVYSCVATISGTTITLSTRTKICSDSGCFIEIETFAFEAGYALVSWAEGSSASFKGTVIKVSGGTITVGTASFMGYGLYFKSFFLIDKNTLVSLSGKSDSHQAYPYVFTRNGLMLTLASQDPAALVSDSDDFNIVGLPVLGTSYILMLKILRQSSERSYVTMGLYHLSKDHELLKIVETERALFNNTYASSSGIERRLTPNHIIKKENRLIVYTMSASDANWSIHDWLYDMVVKLTNSRVDGIISSQATSTSYGNIIIPK